MNTKNLIPNTDLSVSDICLGTMNFGQQVDEAGGHAQLNYYVDAYGGNFIDTAEIYPIPPELHLQGDTELIVGNWLANRGDRDKLVIATKVGAANFIKTRVIGDKPDYSEKSILEAIEGSLKRLQTDYIDLYQVHFPDRKSNFFGVRGVVDFDGPDGTDFLIVAKTMSDLIKDGKIRHWGVSNESAWGLMRYLEVCRSNNLVPPETIQNQYSLLNRTFEIGLSEVCLRENVGLLAFSPLNMGVLTGKYLDGSATDDSRFIRFERNRDRYMPTRAEAATKAYVQLAKDTGITPAQLAIAFTLSRRFVSSSIIGATSLEQLKDNLGATKDQITEQVLQKITELYNQFPDITH